MVASRWTLAVLGSFAAVLVWSGSALAGTGCGRTAHLVCSTVEVPVDRTGQVAGTISLHVEVLPSGGISRGVMFLVAGGPGQGSAQSFDLGDPGEAQLLQFMYPGDTLVAYDDRGTGRSEPLDCAALDSFVAANDPAQIAASCAGELGPAAAFYSTADHAADLEAVRQSLGFDKIGITGVSYGTKLALEYAASFPAHVERLVLDSVVRPDVSDPFMTNVLQAMPGTLAHYCADGACAQATPDFAGDVAAVANKLAARPLRGRVLLANGRRVAVTLDALTFLSVVFEADLDSGLAAELPAAVHAARAGDGLPLLHVLQLGGGGGQTAVSEFSAALYLATVCDDQPFAWSPGMSAADRAASVESALTALPAGSFRPFGPWAAGLGDAATCAGWPDPANDVPAPAAAMPDVPVLAFSGGLDLRTPTSNAAAVVSRFPQGHLVTVPGVGHSVLTADTTFCAQLALRRWIQDGTTPKASCPRAKPFVETVPAFTTASAARLTPGQTRAAAMAALREAEAMWLSADGYTASLGGIYSGKIQTRETGFTLTSYSTTPGVTVTGRLRATRYAAPMVFAGVVTIGGSRASHGKLTLAHGELTGLLRSRH